jgi:hypothetical protein
MVGCLVEANTIRAGCSAYAAGLFVGVELEVADEVARVVVEVGEMLSRGLLQGD